MSFSWKTDTPVLDFWWHLPWVSNQGGSHLHASCQHYIPKIPLGATPANLLMACMVAGQILHAGF